MTRSNLAWIPLLAALGACALPANDTIAASPTEAPAVAAPPPLAPVAYDPRTSLAPLVDRVEPSVVYIAVKQTVDVSQQVPDWALPFMDPRAMPHEQTRQGLGSGFIISEDGYILTNNHVVADADEVEVTVWRGPDDTKVYDAKVIGTDPRIDVGLVKIEAKEKLVPIPMGSSEALRVGDWVVAIGNPFGLSHTVTSGIVSAKGRTIGAGPYDDFIQTDASINPGNSGGPLFNLEGEVVGINTAVNAAGQGIAYAIPIDMVRAVLDDLKSTGTVARGWLGVSLQPLDEDLALGFGLKDEHGALVSEVSDGTPAERAGLVPGDVITALDGQPVKDSAQLIRQVGTKRPGDKVELSVVSKGKTRPVAVVLGSRPDELAMSQPRSTPREEEPAEQGVRKLGIEVRELGRYGAARGYDAGLMVVGVSSDGAAKDKLAPGDIIMDVNGTTVHTVDEFRSVVSKAGEVAVFRVERQGQGSRFESIRLKS